MTNSKMVTVELTGREAMILADLVLAKRWDVEDGGSKYKELMALWTKLDKADELTGK